MKKYIVREGDTMWSISKMTGVRLNLLMAANPQISDPNRLQTGDVISIPELNKPQPSPHSVQPAVTGTTSSPSPKPTAPDAMPGYFGFVWPHVVKQGETWESVANQHGVLVDELRRMNPELANRPLRDGDIVYVPSMAGAPGEGGAVPSQMGQGVGTPGAAGAPLQGLPMPITPGAAGAQPGGTTSFPGAAPTMPYPGAPSGMPNMQGYPGGPGGYPGIPGQPPMMPGHPQQGMPYGYGADPNPYRDGYWPYGLPYWPYAAALPYAPYAGMPPYAQGGLPAEAARNLWMQSQQVPPEWLRDWDESSSWESDWESDWEPTSPKQEARAMRPDSGDSAKDKWGNHGEDELDTK